MGFGFAIGMHAQSDANRYSMSGNTVVPEGVVRCIRMVSPNYPLGTTSEDQKEAYVTVRVRIQRSGIPVPLNMIAGPANLEIEAENAVRQWRFKPYSQGGDPVEVITQVKVRFAPGKPGGIVTYPVQ
jgi:outer membrane biosynthesis protein TonB